MHLSSDVSPADVRVLLEEDSIVLDFPCFLLAERIDLVCPRVRTVYWVDSNRVILDDHLALASLWQTRVLDLELALSLRNPCCLVRHSVDRVCEMVYMLLLQVN
jgi:hypothetical protein